MLRGLRVVGLVVSAGLGILAGVQFASGAARAAHVAYATYLWCLIAGLGLMLAALALGHFPAVRWGRALAFSGSVFLGQTTTYLAALLVIAGPATQAASLSSWLVPACYAASGAMVPIGGLLCRRRQ